MFRGDTGPHQLSGCIGCSDQRYTLRLTIFQGSHLVERELELNRTFFRHVLHGGLNRATNEMREAVDSMGDAMRDIVNEQDYMATDMIILKHQLAQLESRLPENSRAHQRRRRA